MKQVGCNSQTLTDDKFNWRELTPGVNDTPPYVDSQPIPCTCLEKELQLAIKGSSNLTTASGGVISTQGEVPPVPVSTEYVLKSAVHAKSFSN